MRETYPVIGVSFLTFSQNKDNCLRHGKCGIEIKQIKINKINFYMGSTDNSNFTKENTRYSLIAVI